MAASDHLAPRLFHGSTHWFKPGEVIEPRTDLPYNEYEGEYDEDEKRAGYGTSGAYATTSLDNAKWFSGMRLFRNNLKEKQGSLFAPVYEVKHLSEHSDPLNKLDAQNRRDTSGFKPVRIAGYSNWNDLTD